MQAISHGLKFMINFLHSKVNMKFEVQFQINFVVFFVRHKFSIIPHLEKINDYGLSELFNINLKEFLLLNIFECVHELTISLL